MSTQEMTQTLEHMRTDSATKNKKGIAFITASIFIWGGILLLHILPLTQMQKNLYTWFAVAFLMPLALLFCKLFKIRLQNKENPLNELGLLFAMNQVLYIFIVCWVYSAMPEKMLMVLAMVFGGHLLPFGWLYQSKSYTVFSFLVTFSALVVGSIFPSWTVALTMAILEIALTICLVLENKKLSK